VFSNARASVFGLVGCVLSCCVLYCVSCSRMQALVCLGWCVVFSIVAYCAACLVLECKRLCVCVGGLCSLLLRVVLRVLFSNASACVFVLVGCILSCFVLCCVSCSRMQALVCLCWWVVFSPVLCCAACLVLECKHLCDWVGGLCSLLLRVVLRVVLILQWQHG
jgi:hypothetical protein